MAEEKRPKANEVFANSNFLFTQKVDSFEKAYPSIKSLRVEVVEFDLGRPEPIRTSVYTEKSFRHAVDCSNSICYGGGVELGWILSDMMRSRTPSFSDTSLCKGFEGSPKGHKRYRSCLHRFQFKIDITFQPECDDIEPKP